MENKYGNLPPTPLLKKKSLVESFARKQKRNTLGGPGGLAPVGQAGSGDALLIVPKQQSLAQVVRKSNASNHNTNSPPLVRLRRRADSEPPPYSPAWGKRPRRREWHESSARPALPLDVAILLGHVPANLTVDVDAFEHEQPLRQATGRSQLLRPSIVSSATAPSHPTASLNPPVRTSTLQPATRSFAQHAQIHATHSNSNPASPNTSAGTLKPTLTSASVAQFFDAQKGSFQKLGNDKKSLKESKLTLRINDTSRSVQNNEDTLKRTMTIHSLLDSLSNVHTLSKSGGTIPPQSSGSVAHSSDDTSSATSASQNGDLLVDVMEMSRQARKERSKRLQLRQSIFAGTSASSLPTALAQPGSRNTLRSSSSNLVTIPTQQTAANEKEQASTSERETRDRNNRGSCAREKPWGGIHLFNSDGPSSNGSSTSLTGRRERGPADIEATTGSCNEKEDSSSHSLTDSGGTLVALNPNRSGDGEADSHSSSSSQHHAAPSMILQHSPSHAGNRTRSSMPLRQSGSNVLAAMARESGERDSSNAEFTPGQSSASHVPTGDGVSASSQPPSRSNSTNSSQCLPDLANKRNSGGVSSRSNSNSSIHSSPKQSHHPERQAPNTQHHVPPPHVTPFVIAGRSKQSIARHPSVDSEGHDGELGLDEAPSPSLLLSAERSPRGHFLSNRRESSAREAHGSSVVSRDSSATTISPVTPISIPQSITIDLNAGALEAASAGSNSSSLSPHSTIRDMPPPSHTASASSLNSTATPLSTNASLRGGLERREASVTSESSRKAVQQSSTLRTVGRQSNFTGTSPRSSSTPSASQPSPVSPAPHLSASTPAPHSHNARSLSKSTPNGTPNRQLAQTMGPQTLHGSDPSAASGVDLKSMSVGARKKYYSELEFTDLLKDDILISYFRAYLLKHDSDNAFRLDFILEVVDMKQLTNPTDVTNKIATIKKTYFSPGARTFLRGVDSEPILNPKPTFPPAPKNTVFDALVVEFQSQLHCVEFQSFLRSKVMDSFLSERHGGHATHGKLGGSHKKSLAMKLGKKEKGKTITADDFTLPPSSTAGNYSVPRLMLNPEELELFTQQIITASELGKFAELRPLLQQKEATLVINDCNPSGVFALYVASKGGHLDCVMALLAVDEVNVNQRSPKTGDTALHVAAENDQFDLIALLLYAGAKSQLANKQGISARQAAKGRTAEVFTSFDGIGETGRFKKLYPIIKRFEEFNLHSSQPPTPTTPHKRSISRSYTTSGKEDRPNVASPRDYFKNPFSPRKGERVDKAAEKQAKDEKDLHRSESGNNNPKLDRVKSGGREKDKNREKSERAPLEREPSNDRRERSKPAAKISRGEKDHYGSDSASSRQESEASSRAEKASSQREKGLTRTPTKNATREATQQPQQPRFLSVSCLNRTLAVTNDDDRDTNFLDFLEKEFGQRLDYDAVTLRNQSGEPVTFAHEATLRTFAHEGAIFVDVLGMGKRDAIDGEHVPDENAPLTQETINDFCDKCWQGDLEGFYAFFRNPAIDQRKLINSLSTRGQTGLYCASRCGHTAIVVFLLRHPGMDSINVLSSTGGQVKSTALHAAGFAQHADIVALLLAKGANIEVKNDLGLVPKQEAFDKETRKAWRVFETEGMSGLQREYKIILEVVRPDSAGHPAPSSATATASSESQRGDHHHHHHYAASSSSHQASPLSLAPPSLDANVNHVYYDEDGQLVGARLRELLKICLQSLPQDSTVVRAMIYGHTHYVTSVEVFETLVEMYKVANKSEKQKIITAFVLWIGASVDIFLVEPLHEALKVFVSYLADSDDMASGTTLMKTFYTTQPEFVNYQAKCDKFEALFEERLALITESGRDPDTPSPSILSFPAIEVAYHIAMIDEFMSSKIGIEELIKKNYEKKDLSPNVSAMVTRFNEMTEFISHTISAEPTAKRRAKVIGYFIVVASKLMKLHDCHGLLTVYVGLMQESVSQGAGDAMKLLTKKEAKTWQKIQAFCSPIGNFRELRAIHDNRFEIKIVSPILYIKDMTAINEGNLDYFDDEKLMLNIDKIEILGAKIGSVSESTKRKAMFLDREVHNEIFDFLLFEINCSTKRRANAEDTNAT